TMDAETIPSSQQTTELELHISPILTNDNVDDVAFVGNAHHTNVFEEAWNQIKSHLSSSDSEKDMSSDEMDVDNNDNTMHDNKDSMQIHYSDIGGQVHSPVMKLEEGGEHPDEGTTSLDHSQTNIKHLGKQQREEKAHQSDEKSDSDSDSEPEVMEINKETQNEDNGEEQVMVIEEQDQAQEEQPREKSQQTQSNTLSTSLSMSVSGGPKITKGQNKAKIFQGNRKDGQNSTVAQPAQNTAVGLCALLDASPGKKPRQYKSHNKDKSQPGFNPFKQFADHIATGISDTYLGCGLVPVMMNTLLENGPTLAKRTINLRGLDEKYLAAFEKEVKVKQLRNKHVENALFIGVHRPHIDLTSLVDQNMGILTNPVKFKGVSGTEPAYELVVINGSHRIEYMQTKSEWIGILNEYHEIIKMQKEGTATADHAEAKERCIRALVENGVWSAKFFDIDMINQSPQAASIMLDLAQNRPLIQKLDTDTDELGMILNLIAKTHQQNQDLVPQTMQEYLNLHNKTGNNSVMPAIFRDKLLWTELLKYIRVPQFRKGDRAGFSTRVVGNIAKTHSGVMLPQIRFLTQVLDFLATPIEFASQSEWKKEFNQTLQKQGSSSSDTSRERAWMLFYQAKVQEVQKMAETWLASNESDWSLLERKHLAIWEDVYLADNNAKSLLAGYGAHPKRHTPEYNIVHGKRAHIFNLCISSAREHARSLSADDTSDAAVVDRGMAKKLVLLEDMMFAKDTFGRVARFAPPPTKYFFSGVNQVLTEVKGALEQ
ncbi:hypothetical protein CONPUDRAFT_78495, partial [Coniophora puteana RWD-64-598 SS2]